VSGAEKLAGQTPAGLRQVPVRRHDTASQQDHAADYLALEEPLEIRLAWPGLATPKPIAVTMRTPGDDAHLVRGFLLTEGVVGAESAIVRVTEGAGEQANRVTVHLHTAPKAALERLERHFFVSSSCGICGKASIDAIRVAKVFEQGPESDELRISAQALLSLPRQLSEQQKLFHDSGSLHAAALFAADGRISRVCEDVGRHNALDKLLGHGLIDGELPLAGRGVLVSGRASFELVQKAHMAGCRLLAAVGAPSSLAVELAWDTGMTLVGFLRDGRFNVYTGPDRVC